MINIHNMSPLRLPMKSPAKSPLKKPSEHHNYAHYDGLPSVRCFIWFQWRTARFSLPPSFMVLFFLTQPSEIVTLPYSITNTVPPRRAPLVPPTTHTTIYNCPLHIIISRARMHTRRNIASKSSCSSEPSSSSCVWRW